MKGLKAVQGMALVATLLVSVTLLIFGTGAIFLTQTDLTITDNVRANALVQARADAGLEASLIALELEVAADGTLPTSFQLPTLDLIGEQGQFVTSPDAAPLYEMRSPNEAALRVQGVGPREASFVSEAVVSLNATPAQQGVGLTAGGTVSIASWSDTRVLGALHGDGGYALDGIDFSKFGTCTLRDPGGACGIWQAHDMLADANADGVPDALNVTAAIDRPSYLCEPAGSAALCDSSSGSATPRQFAQAEVKPVDTDAFIASVLAPCTVTHTAPLSLTSQAEATAAGFSTGNTVCVSGDLALSGVTLDGVTILAEVGTMSLSNVELLNSHIVAKSGTLNLQDSRADSSTLYSKADFSLDNTNHLTGTTTLIGGASLDFSAATEVSNAGTDPQVSVNVVAQKDIRYAAASDSFAQFAAGESFVADSTACIVGSVSAVQDIVAHGGICIDTGLLAQGATPASTTLSVASRR